MKTFTPGSRVIFTQAYEIFPCDVIIPRGARGTVREIENAVAYVALDETFPNLANWGNAAEFLFDIADDNGLTLQEYLASHLALIPARGYLAEFSRWAFSDMPEIPAGFIDQSWHNDTMPHWENADARLSLWIDHSDADECEVAGTPRFALYAMDADGQMIEPALLESETWPEMSRYIAALTSCADNEQGAAHCQKLKTNAAWVKLVCAGFSIWHSGGGIYLWAKNFPIPHAHNSEYILATMAQDECDLGEDGALTGWNVEVTDKDGSYLAQYDFRGQTLDACLTYVARYVPVFTRVDEIAESAINHLAREVQDAIGQTDGGVAGVFFSGDENREPLAEIIRNYILHEMIYADGKA